MGENEGMNSDFCASLLSFNMTSNATLNISSQGASSSLDDLCGVYSELNGNILK